MLTLEDIKLYENDEVVIYFSYEGNDVEFNGNMKMTQKQFLASRQSGDEYLAKCILQRELHWWINKG